MRNFIFQLIIIASALFAGVSCSKEKVTLYTEAPGIYFNGFSTTYNFTEHPENVEIGCDTVNIPFLITGSAMDKERVIKVRLSPEDTITAEESMYELLSGSVPAGSYQGQLQVKINYSPLLDDSVYVNRASLPPLLVSQRQCGSEQSRSGTLDHDRYRGKSLRRFGERKTDRIQQ